MYISFKPGEREMKELLMKKTKECSEFMQLRGLLPNFWSLVVEKVAQQKHHWSSTSQQAVRCPLDVETALTCRDPRDTKYDIV